MKNKEYTKTEKYIYIIYHSYYPLIKLKSRKMILKSRRNQKN